MANLTTSACDNTAQYWLLYRSGYKRNISGVKSISQIDVDLYDGHTHSQLIGADHLGNPHIQLKTSISADTNPLGYTPNSNTEAATQATALTVALQPLDGAQSQSAETDGAFVQTTTPGKTQKMVSFFAFWSDTGATGNLLALVPIHRLEDWGVGEPESV